MTTRRQVTPLLTIETDAFSRHYYQGVWWSMYGDEQGQGLVRDSYLVTNIQACIERGYFDGQHTHCFSSFGFYLGMYHGGTLLPSTGQQRSDVTTLVALHNHNAASGYCVGREWYFTEAEPHERRYTERLYVERLRDIGFETSPWSHAIGKQ